MTNVFQDEFTEALAQADEVLIGAIHRAERFPDNERLDAEAMVQRFREKGLAGKAFSTNEALGESLLAEEFKPEEKVLVAFFSNGSFDGVIDQVAERLC